MHLQQTKAGSRATGGPQYFFHNLPAGIKDFLRHKGVCPVVLQTPYGIAPSSFRAVGRDHKLTTNGRAVAGKVGHDRIQGTESIGEAIRRWYGLPHGRDFERIDVNATMHPDGHFILAPLRVYLRGKTHGREIEQIPSPLSFNTRAQSGLWKRQIAAVFRQQPRDANWICEQVRQVVRDHQATHERNTHEVDLLRAAGALAKLGMQLGPYLVRHYDCASYFHFLNFIEYQCPVEVKKRSSGFRYQMARYHPLPRAVVLCVHHDIANVPEHIDVVELSFMAKYLDSV
jgi:hypothetical protein